MEKISAPGVYDMPIEVYHSDCCIGPSISSSGLRKIELESPAHYWDESYLNPEAERKDTTALRLGKAAHALALGMEHFDREFIISPFDDFRTKAAREWRDEQTRVVLKEAEFDQLQRMAEVLRRDPFIEAGILQGEVEKSIIWRDPIATRIAFGSPEDPEGENSPGIWVKTRPDSLPLDCTITDYKTIASADDRSCHYALRDHGYHMQLALTFDGIRIVLGRECDTFAIIFQEKKRPFCTNVKPLYAEDIRWGRIQNRAALNRFALGIRTGQWPGYSNQPSAISLGDFEREKLEARTKLDRNDPLYLDPNGI